MPSLQKFRAPPINEVVCGLMFEAVPGLDPLTIGFYAKERASDFPRHELHPALGAPTVILGGGAVPIRAWLMSVDDAFVIQLQADRFYLNWRARGTEYPRFSGFEGREGIVQKLIREFEQFGIFCEREFGKKPVVTGFELAKIDQLIEGKHWNGLKDLGEVVPWLRTVPSFSHSDSPLISIRFVEPRPGGQLSVSLDLATGKNGDGPVRLVKLESRIIRGGKGEIGAMSEEFLQANEELNEVFSAVIPLEQAMRRFN